MPCVRFRTMAQFRVLIVEDDLLIAADVEETLHESGCDVCGVAASQEDALIIAESARPEFAVVDVELSPGDGRIVARELTVRYGTAVLFATGNSVDPTELARYGAGGCLPKPYDSRDVLPALAAVRDIRAGRSPGHLPGGMIAFSRWA